MINVYICRVMVDDCRRIYRVDTLFNVFDLHYPDDYI